MSKTFAFSIIVASSMISSISCSHCEDIDKTQFVKFSNCIINAIDCSVEVGCYYKDDSGSQRYEERTLDTNDSIVIDFIRMSGCYYPVFGLIDSIRFTRHSPFATVQFSLNDRHEYSPFIAYNCDSIYDEKRKVYIFEYKIKDKIFEQKQ